MTGAVAGDAQMEALKQKPRRSAAKVSLLRRKILQGSGRLRVELEGKLLDGTVQSHVCPVFPENSDEIIV